MIIIPREKPVIQQLNSYYLNIDKFIEHYQGELGAGTVHFRSSSAEAVLFFDEQSMVSGYLEDHKQKVHGKEVVGRIIEMVAGNNFVVSVYRIPPERLYFWANLPNSKPRYKDLTSEFTDLEGLIKKMEGEQLTGFIDVELNNGEGGLLFFYNGQVIGGSSADGGGSVDRSREYRDDLIRRSKEHGGRFNVAEVFLEPEEGSTAGNDQMQKGAAGGSKTAGRPQGTGGAVQINRERVLEMLRELLATLESVVQENRRIRSDFETLLSRKFVEKVDKYEFLDPFLAEFRYAGGKVSYEGDAQWGELVNAVWECINEIAQANGLSNQLNRRLDDWRKRFAGEIKEFDINL
ncbi:MAG: hypothetical protein K9J79_00235 [Desulfobacteraceae bacterium]|nr:hypothetical protein [Desulfobacteraceae bacterium]